MTHNPLHRIAKLRRELEAINKNWTFHDRIICEANRVAWFHAKFNPIETTCVIVHFRLELSPRHTTEEHALKSAVRIARHKIAKMKRGG